MTVKGHSGKIWCIAIITNNAFIVSGSSDKTIRIWSYEKFMNTLEGLTDDFLSVASITGTKLIVSGSREKAVRIWNF